MLAFGWGYAKGLGGVDVTYVGRSMAEGRRKQEGCLQQMAQAIVTWFQGRGHVTSLFKWLGSLKWSV